MKRKRLFAAGLLILVFACAFYFRAGVRFDWWAFEKQLRGVGVWHLVAGVLLIHATFWVRAVRWVALLGPGRRVRAVEVVGAQFIGFTAVALFGRLADLTRPYLVSGRVGRPVASQVAVYTVERMFDLGAAGIWFSAGLALTPQGAAHHAIYARAGLLSLLGTGLLALFAVGVRVFGEGWALLAGRGMGRFSARMGDAVREKMMGFRVGMEGFRMGRELVAVTVLSLLMWGMIAESYVLTVHAFGSTPELAGLSFGGTMPLMAVSMGSSLLQLPVVGWFTQIALTAGAMHTLYGAPAEAASACGAMLLCVLTLSTVPGGLLFARLEGVSLKGAAEASSKEGRAAA